MRNTKGSDRGIESVTKLEGIDGFEGSTKRESIDGFDGATKRDGIDTATKHEERINTATGIDGVDRSTSHEVGRVDSATKREGHFDVATMRERLANSEAAKPHVGDRVDIDAAVSRYREQLTREADLGRGTLDEIEDHLRLLIDDLRATGMPAAVAVTEAARRLGDPRALARESARVRTPFGAKLPAWRAWIAIALLLPLIAQMHAGSRGWVGLAETGLALGLVGALAWRSAWSRAVLLGVMVSSIVWMGVQMFGGFRPPPMLLGLELGAMVMLAPWRRAELTAPGVALALLYFMYAASSWMLMWQLSGPPGGFGVPDARLAMVGTLVAGAGLVLRAKWAAIAAVATAVLLALWWQVIAGIDFRVPDGAMLRVLFLCLMGSGVLSSLVVAAIAWRTARSRFGELRGVLA